MTFEELWMRCYKQNYAIAKKLYNKNVGGAVADYFGGKIKKNRKTKLLNRILPWQNNP